MDNSDAVPPAASPQNPEGGTPWPGLDIDAIRTLLNGISTYARRQFPGEPLPFVLAAPLRSSWASASISRRGSRKDANVPAKLDQQLGEFQRLIHKGVSTEGDHASLHFPILVPRDRDDRERLRNRVIFEPAQDVVALPVGENTIQQDHVRSPREGTAKALHTVKSADDCDTVRFEAQFKR